MPKRRSSAVVPLPWFRSLDLWGRFVQEQAAMAQSASVVVGRRTARMATHGLAPNAAERRELRAMVDEKHAALVEGSIAACQEWMRLGQAAWLEALRLSMRNGTALVPLTTAATPFEAPTGARHGARRKAASGPWTTALDASLRIADAALKPTRKRVAANHRRLTTRGTR